MAQTDREDAEKNLAAHREQEPGSHAGSRILEVALPTGLGA